MFPRDGGAASLTDRRMALAHEWDGLVEQVRSLGGEFEDFHRPLRLDRLLPAADSGPVVVVNVGRWRCDALIVMAGGVEIVPLPRLTAQALAEQTRSFLRELGAVRSAAGDDAAHALRDLTSTVTAFDRGLLGTLEWLWDTIAEPVLERAGYTQAPRADESWPRLWWCPTGMLTLLPLHAAGHHGDAGRERTVIDRVVSSYTPTLRALVEARQPRPEHDDSGSDRMLLVALGDVAGEARLPAVEQERDALTNVFPHEYTLIEGRQATIANVRRQLRGHRWAHFSCHGTQDLSDPSKGGLVLDDGTLDIPTISAERRGGEFVFLSACKTATVGLGQPDEAISVSTALHYVGYRHVIGTLWSVYDQAAADLAAAVYRDLTATGRFEPQRAAHALHQAVRALRATHGLGVSAWTPFTHTGP